MKRLLALAIITLLSATSIAQGENIFTILEYKTKALFSGAEVEVVNKKDGTVLLSGFSNEDGIIRFEKFKRKKFFLRVTTHNPNFEDVELQNIQSNSIWLNYSESYLEEKKKQDALRQIERDKEAKAKREQAAKLEKETKETPQSNQGRPYENPEKKAQYPGGDHYMQSYIRSNTRYPRPDYAVRRQGIVELKFIVRKDGRINDIKVIRSLSQGLDAEAKRLVRSMPRWTPAKQNGKTVDSYYNLFIDFRIYNNSYKRY